MDGTRIRMVAMACPLTLAGGLVLAALVGQPAERPVGPHRGDVEARPATTRATAVTTPAVLDLAQPAPPPVEQARPGADPVPTRTPETP